jgi:hypothetical protein
MFWWCVLQKTYSFPIIFSSKYNGTQLSFLFERRRSVTCFL